MPIFHLKRPNIKSVTTTLKFYGHFRKCHPIHNNAKCNATGNHVMERKLCRVSKKHNCRGSLSLPRSGKHVCMMRMFSLSGRPAFLHSETSWASSFSNPKTLDYLFIILIGRLIITSIFLHRPTYKLKIITICSGKCIYNM